MGVRLDQAWKRDAIAAILGGHPLGREVRADSGDAAVPEQQVGCGRSPGADVSEQQFSGHQCPHTVLAAFRAGVDVDMNGRLNSTSREPVNGFE